VYDGIVRTGCMRDQYIPGVCGSVRIGCMRDQYVPGICGISTYRVYERSVHTGCMRDQYIPGVCGSVRTGCMRDQFNTRNSGIDLSTARPKKSQYYIFMKTFNEKYPMVHVSHVAICPRLSFIRQEDVRFQFNPYQEKVPNYLNIIAFYCQGTLIESRYMCEKKD